MSMFTVLCSTYVQRGLKPGFQEYTYNRYSDYHTLYHDVRKDIPCHIDSACFLG